MTTTSATPLDHRQQQPQREREEAPALKPQMKKQARRRTHTSRPYQERLLNMAEARREIVTALKIHRASMRQPPRYHQPEQPPPPPPQQQQQAQMVFQFQDQSQAVVEEALAAPTMSHASAASFADQLCSPPLAHLSYSPPLLPYHLAPPPLDLMGERLASCASLPAQPLGLNLSFQGFSGYVDDAKQQDDCGDLDGVPLTQSSSPAASPWPAYSATEMETMASTHGSPAVINTAAEEHPSVDAPAAPLMVSPVLGDGETQPIGGRPQGVEWSGTTTAADVAAAAASAWWSRVILEGMESGGGGEEEEGAVGGGTAEDLAAAASGLPVEWRWPCDDGAVAGPEPPQDVLETMLVDGDYSGCCYQGAHGGDGGDTLLPCMDDIEGWDGEWFSTSADHDHSLDAAHGCAVDQQSGDV